MKAARLTIKKVSNLQQPRQLLAAGKGSLLPCGQWAGVCAHQEWPQGPSKREATPFCPSVRPVNHFPVTVRHQMSKIITWLSYNCHHMGQAGPRQAARLSGVSTHPVGHQMSELITTHHLVLVDVWHMRLDCRYLHRCCVHVMYIDVRIASHVQGHPPGERQKGPPSVQRQMQGQMGTPSRLGDGQLMMSMRAIIISIIYHRYHYHHTRACSSTGQCRYQHLPAPGSW